MAKLKTQKRRKPAERVQVTTEPTTRPAAIAATTIDPRSAVSQDATPIAEVCIRIRPGVTVMAWLPVVRPQEREEYGGQSESAEVVNLTRSGALVRTDEDDPKENQLVFVPWYALALELAHLKTLELVPAAVGKAG